MYGNRSRWREYFTLRGFKSALTEISRCADGNVVAASSEDGTVKLFEMENGNAIKTGTPTTAASSLFAMPAMAAS